MDGIGIRGLAQANRPREGEAEAGVRREISLRVVSRQGERTDLGQICPRLSLEQAAVIATKLANMRLGANQHTKVGGPIDPPSINLPAHSFNGLVDKRRRLRAFALALASAAQFVYRLPGEPLQVPNKLFAGGNLFRIVQRKSKLPAAVRT